VNTYRTDFFARCPVNGLRIRYALEIRTLIVIPVEAIIERVELIREGFHEAIADDLHAAFGGEQKLVAEHHGVVIETTRP
jgi:hypothetical protein